MTEYHQDLEEMEREVERMRMNGAGRGGGGERRGGGARAREEDASEAEIWKRGKLKRVRRKANKVADSLLAEFQRRLGDVSGDVGKGRETVWRREPGDEIEDEEEEEWDRDEWRD